MEEKKVSYIVHEGAMARAERAQRRLWITSLIMLGLLVGSNLAWYFHLFG